MPDKWVPPADVQLRIVCAANRCEKKIILGARHWDDHMRSAAQPFGLPHSAWEQGFIDQYGRFCTRKEAHKIALEAGQILRRCGNDEDLLYTENLY